MAQYPNNAATDADLYVAVNNKNTTLVGALTASGGNYSGTEIEVADTTGFPSTGLITIDLEVISYTGVATSPHRFTGITRGQDGTTAASHASSSFVYHRVVAAHHNVLKEEVKAIEDDLVNGMTNPLKLPNGTAALPAATFETDPDTGMYRFSSNVLGFTAGGTLGFFYSGNSALVMNTGIRIRGDYGSAAEPGFGFNDDDDTGIYRPSANTLAFSTNGVEAGKFSSTGAFSAKGTNTNDSAAAGYIGQFVSSTVTSNTNCPTTDQAGDLTSISLTAGDWDVTVQGRMRSNGATWSEAGIGFSPSSGNSYAGLVSGENFASALWANSSTTPIYVHFSTTWRVSLASTTTYYLKYFASYTSGTPQSAGVSIQARRVR